MKLWRIDFVVDHIEADSLDGSRFFTDRAQAEAYGAMIRGRLWDCYEEEITTCLSDRQLRVLLAETFEQLPIAWILRQIGDPPDARHPDGGHPDRRDESARVQACRQLQTILDHRTAQAPHPHPQQRLAWEGE